MHHAYVLTGADQTLLMTEALSEAALLLTPTDKPPDIHPDCHILDNQGEEIKIDQTRVWKQLAQLKPNEAEQHVFIMVSADHMNHHAQNTLLKLLEDPPSACVFYLLCENETMLLPTVRSRCQIKRITGCNEGVDAEAETWAGKWIRLSEMRDELGLLTHALSAEKLPRDRLKNYFSALSAAMYQNMQPPLTASHCLFMIKKVNEARLALDGNAGGGHLLTALTANSFDV
jgi:hypothetical protein